MQLVQFFTADKIVTIRNRKKLKSFIIKLLQIEGSRELIQLSFIFCSDTYLLEINRNFLNHDFYTDIVTFDLSSSADTLNGEVYISTDRVKENAESLCVSFKEELHRVIFHGALHLCGYKDKTKSQKALMREKENEHLEQYFN